MSTALPILSPFYFSNMYYGGYDGQYQWSIDLSRYEDKIVHKSIDVEEVWCRQGAGCHSMVQGLERESFNNMAGIETFSFSQLEKTRCIY